MATSGYQFALVGSDKTAQSATLLPWIPAHQIASFGGLLLGIAPTGLTPATTYTASIVVDGVIVPITILGSDAPTFDDLVDELDARLAASGAMSEIAAGDLKVSSSMELSTSEIAITDGTLFAALAGFVEILPMAGPTSQDFDFLIDIDGAGGDYVTIDSADAETFGEMVTAIIAAMVGASVAIIGGNLKFSSNTTGALSSIALTDDGDTGLPLFTNLNGFTAFEAAVAGSKPYLSGQGVKGSLQLGIQPGFKGAFANSTKGDQP